MRSSTRLYANPAALETLRGGAASTIS